MIHFTIIFICSDVKQCTTITLIVFQGAETKDKVNVMSNSKEAKPASAESVELNGYLDRIKRFLHIFIFK